MPTDRLARLRALIEQLGGLLNAANEHWQSQKPEGKLAIALAITKLAELEGVLAIPTQAQEVGPAAERIRQIKTRISQSLRLTTGDGLFLLARIENLEDALTEAQAALAAPTPADGAPQEQEP